MYQKIGKRLFDIAIALVAFILLLPLLLVVAVLIKCFDKGPLIFVQKRIGRGGEAFNFYKFRSMPVDTKNLPSDSVGAIKLTWIGSLIRRTNIDELPQLYNILIGDMSIVGPRPPIPSQIELIERRMDNGSLMLRPGLTGLAQVNAFDGMTIEQKAEFDGKYSESLGFVQDVRIIFGTLLYLFRPPPVY